MGEVDRVGSGCRVESSFLRRERPYARRQDCYPSMYGRDSIPRLVFRASEVERDLSPFSQRSGGFNGTGCVEGLFAREDDFDGIFPLHEFRPTCLVFHITLDCQPPRFILSFTLYQPKKPGSPEGSTLFDSPQ